MMMSSLSRWLRQWASTGQGRWGINHVRAGLGDHTIAIRIPQTDGGQRLPHRWVSQRGAVWTLTLMVLAMSSLMVTPTILSISSELSATNKLDQRLLDRYASDAGAEHALWRLQYESGFQASLNPTVSYVETFNGINTTIDVTSITPPPPAPPPPPPPQQSGKHIAMAKTVTPQYATPGESTTYTYTLLLQNYGTAKIHLDEIGDLLPQGITYIAGSTVIENFDDDDDFPENPNTAMVSGRQQLTWSFTGERPAVEGGETATITFQATAALPEGTHLNEAWVTPKPSDHDPIYTGPTSPIVVGMSQFDVTSTAGGIVIRVRAEDTPTGVVIRSWQAQ